MCIFTYPNPINSLLCTSQFTTTSEDSQLGFALGNKGCVTLWPCHFTLKHILRQKKNYGNSNISPCKNIILKKILLKKTKILQDIITLYKLISSFNTSQSIIFQRSSYKNRPIYLGGQNPLSYYILYNEPEHNISLPRKASKANKVCKFMWLCKSTDSSSVRLSCVAYNT
jgi:hypothetical protein